MTTQTDTAAKLANLPGHRRTRCDTPTVEIPYVTVQECARLWREAQAAAEVSK